MLARNIIQSQMVNIKDNEWQDDAMKTVATAGQRHVPVILAKNRYSSILPDEFCQIFLQQLPNQDSTSRYINAIRVNSFLSPNRYIVTQHPLPVTLSDFWRLILEQQSTVIINLNPVDDTDQSCTPFWPEQGSQLDIENNIHIVNVKSVNEKEISIHTIKAFYRPNESEETKLTVEIVNFNGWANDKATPQSIENFVAFTIDSASISGKAQPIIVTCHDGATASGLFVALSNLIEQMQTEKICDVCETVRTLRICRKQFVTKEIQMEALYNAVVVYATKFDIYSNLDQQAEI